jgi:hypothetical protein
MPQDRIAFQLIDGEGISLGLVTYPGTMAADARENLEDWWRKGFGVIPATRAAVDMIDAVTA